MTTTRTPVAQARRELLAAAEILRGAGIGWGPAGSATLRLDRERFLFAAAIRGMTASDLCVVELRMKDAEAPPAARLHRTLYSARPEARAIVHAQPVITTALAVAGVTLAQCVLTERCASLCLPGGPDAGAALDSALAELAARTSAILLGRHGLVALGADLSEAIDRIERVEHCARISHAVRQVGVKPALSEREVGRWQAAAADRGWALLSGGCDRCNTCENGHLHRAEPDGEITAAIDDYLGTAEG